MTREQVKQELEELKSIIILISNNVQVNDTKGLQEKYEKAIAKLPYKEQVIFLEKIYKQKPYWKIGLMISYSEEGTRKKYSKIIDKLANMLEIKKTNFDRITASVESFVKWALDNYHSVPEHFPCQTSCNNDCGECFKKWLQKECEG